jgi:hypothetical protein
MYGAMTVQGVRYVYDYHADEPVKESEMTKERLKLSEKAKYDLIAEAMKKDYN